MEGRAVNRRLAGLAAVAALLGGYLAFDGLGTGWFSGGSGVAVPEAGATRAAPAALNPWQDLDTASYAAIVERPLFNPSRLPRPPEPVVETPPPPVDSQPPPEPPPPPPPQGPGPEDYKLLGVASGPDGRIAAVRVAATGDVVYLRQGESVDNWVVVEVADRSIAIGSEGAPVTYSLFATPDAGAGGQPQPDMPAQNQPLPLPLPMPVPQPPPQPDGLPEQHTVPDTGG
ncbi:hypothetical protein DK847_17800 [Aestuariivirga litoralis]|uniref:Type II secretion system protein GspC N-terminal domain-containing protein n=1 Tax=Aestuariivirga litoralis TaxID=2650924 RepID=A0A2W2AQ17_9HYPH|nr:hypothetical protein DK847_17800 [Aestuariivirga litoralis]